VVIPMLNEERFIEDILTAVANQTWPKSALDVVIVDSGSIDASRDIVDRWARTHEWVRVVENPARRQSSAWRRGIEAARGSIVCCINAHAIPAPDFVSSSVDVLQETGAVGVGGRVVHEGLDATSTAIGLAMESRFGMASPHRFVSGRREVDTVSHASYLRDALLRVGLHDESLERNSDYELNYRLREAGGRLVFDDRIESVYRPRSSLAALWRQFWWYGEWKFEVVRRHPRSLRPRHVVPPAAVVVGCALGVMSFDRRFRSPTLGLLGLYVAAVLSATVAERPRRRGASAPALVAAFPIMHAAWGSGFVYSAIRSVTGQRPGPEGKRLTA